MEKQKIKKIRDENIGDAIFNLHEYGINPHTREIFLHSYLHDESGADFEAEPGMDYRMAAVFIKNISLLNCQGKENILIHQHSCGGDWNYGMAIYNAIKASIAPVTILAYAHARSMSSITLQAARLRVLMPDCDFLVHHGHLGFDDRATAVESNMEWWTKHEKPRMLEVYANRCKGSKFFKGTNKKRITEYILAKMQTKTDWILTAEEAVNYGFADGILGGEYKTFESIRK